jgi:hypothetical protein
MSLLHTYTQQEKHLLRRLAGSIISASDQLQLPGADDEAIFSELLRRVERKGEELRQGMANFFAEFGGIEQVANLDDADFQALMDVVQTKQHRFLSTTQVLVVQSYYQNPVVLSALNKPDRPPFPEGNDLEEGDWSLLDPVRKRPPFFRKW